MDDPYERYKKEIKDSQIHDVLKIKIGLKAWRKLLKSKIVLVPMDQSMPDLGLNPE